MRTDQILNSPDRDEVPSAPIPAAIPPSSKWYNEKGPSVHRLVCPHEVLFVHRILWLFIRDSLSQTALDYQWLRLGQWVHPPGSPLVLLLQGWSLTGAGCDGEGPEMPM
jgi:hypothetical protein